MTMSPGVRKITLTAHIVCSVGLLGAVAAFLVLALTGLTTEAPQTARAAYVSAGLLTMSIIVPLSFVSLVTGVVQSLGTPWGLFRHYWVVVKLVLTLLTVVVLLIQTPGIRLLANVAAEAEPISPDLFTLRTSLVVHAAGGLLVLLVTTALSVYKPRGLTRFGWTRTRAQQTSDHASR